MARDYTKYNVKGLGENFNKRQLVFEIVKDYVKRINPLLMSLRLFLKTKHKEVKASLEKLQKSKILNDLILRCP